MAADSLFGGSTNVDSLTQQSLDLLNKFLTDTVGGSHITGAIDGTTILLASGDDGQKQGALVPISQVVTGTINDGVLQLEINMPANTGFVFEGKDNVTPDTVDTFLTQVIDGYLPPANAAPGSHEAILRANLNAAVDDLVAAIKATGVTQVVVRMVDLVNASSSSSAQRAVGPTDLLFKTSTAEGSVEVFGFNLGHLQAGHTLVLDGASAAIVSGAGNIRVEGNTAIRITGDVAEQNITGGAGADTLVGGGGLDTLTGGAGNDVFGFSDPGIFTITDFSAGDQAAFDLAGVTNIAQLAALVTGVEHTAAGVTYHFASADVHITLVGLTAADVTSDMIKFTI